MSETRPRLSDSLPPLIFGTATFNPQHNKAFEPAGSTSLVRKALEHGVKAFDTSPYYGVSELLLGEALDDASIREAFPREQYHVLTKVGRISGAEFDYSPEWVRFSVDRSLQRLRTSYLDVVYCHDVEFVSPDEVMGAVRELRRIRDETGTIKFVGISGYPVDLLCELAERVLRETGEPLDAVMSYSNYTLQNTILAHSGMQRLKAAGVDVVPNAAPLAMGLLRRDGPPAGVGTSHPAGDDLRRAVQAASDFCDSHGERLEVVAIRFALETWLTTGSDVGSRGDPASGVKERTEHIEQLTINRLGVSVIGVSSLAELEKLLQVWRSILDGLENGQETANAAGRWKKDHEWSLNRQKAVQLLAEGIQETIGEWMDHTWPSPPVGYVNQRQIESSREAARLTPEASPGPEDVKSLDTQRLPIR